MEHEVFVPFPAGRLREALADPVRVARAIPGLQQDASAVSGSAADADAGSPPVSGPEPLVSGTGPSDSGSESPVFGTGQDAAETSSRAGRAGAARVAGRLKVRVAGHTITYRGAFRVTAQDDGSYAVEGDASEVRGGGAVKLALTLRLLPADGGTTLAFGGTASGDGRVAELPHDAVSSAGQRLLTRFGETLTADLTTRADSVSRAEAGPGTEPEAASETEPAAGAEPEAGAETETGTGAETETEAEAEKEPGPGPEPEIEAEPEVGAGAGAGAGVEASSLYEADVPPSSLDPLAEDDEFDGEDFVAEAAEPGRADPMAEAAHARRTMIGRSAEEVDHAPPRGRYAPVPPPEATAARATLRWAAPAAALALASAIVVTRALRRRR